jgi:hypothetical protein
MGLTHLTQTQYCANVNTNQLTKNKHMSIFRSHIHFAKPDPLANGLRDEIIAEQNEAEAIHSLEDTTAEELADFWTGVIKDVKKDGDWVDFSND